MYIEVAARLMVARDCGAIPVVGDLVTKLPIGLITDRDIVTRTIAQGRDPMTMTVRDCMTAPALTVFDSMSLHECVKMLELSQIRRAIVTDARGEVVGMIAQADIALHASKREAGELVREISRATAPALAH
jgi:CBS domain-containing protein